MLTLTDPPDETPKSPRIAPEWLRWGIGLALAAFVAYFTTLRANDAQLNDVKNAHAQEIAIVKTRQEENFREVLRRMDAMAADIREVRSEQLRSRR